MVVVPGMTSAPLSVSAPPAVTVRSPVVVNAPRSNALLSLIVTLVMVPDEAANMTVPKVLDWSRSMLCPPATVRVDVPVIANTPLSVILPPAVAVTA